MRREPPAGADPYAEDRARAVAEARAGALCPTNQHGCFYFSSSEWSFCPMCHWKEGRAAGEADSSLAPFGAPWKEHLAEISSGRVVQVNLKDINTIFSTPATKSFMGDLQPWSWKRLAGNQDPKLTIRLTRAQLHNLLMEYGAPHGCLTDQMWLDLQARYPPPPHPYWRE